MTFDAIKSRTFRVKYRSHDGCLFTGTALIVDRGDDRYLVTAYHVVPDVYAPGLIGIFHNGQWNCEVFSVIGTGKERNDRTGPMDVAVLKLKSPLHHPLPQMQHVAIFSGQPRENSAVYSFGFPFEGSTSTEVTRESGVFIGLNIGGPCLRIKGRIMKGMSGGPVAVVAQGDPDQAAGILGIISEMPPSSADSGEALPIFEACDIRYAVDMIESPLGPHYKGSEETLT